MWHVAEVSFAAKVRQRIEAGRRRRDSNALRDVYDRFRGTSSKMVKTSLAQALHELQVGPSNGETIDEICLAFDADRDGLIDFGEFTNAALRPSPIEAWCKQVDWWRAIADAIPPVDHYDQPLHAVARLTDDQIDVICAEGLHSIRSMLHTKARELRNAIQMRDQTTAAAPGAKFHTFKASVGTPEDFFNGLSDRVGAALPSRPLAHAIIFDAASPFEQVRQAANSCTQCILSTAQATATISPSLHPTTTLQPRPGKSGAS